MKLLLSCQEFRNYVHEGDMVCYRFFFNKLSVFTSFCGTQVTRQYLSGEKPITVTLFVPTDEAFANIV